MAFPAVQSTHAEQGFGNTVTAVLGSTPTVGNVLIAGLSIPTGRVLSVPTGWHAINDAEDVGRGTHVSTLWYLVVGGDGTSWPFIMSGSANEIMACTLLEINIDGTTPVDVQNVTQVRDTSIFTPTSLTPSAAGKWGLAFLGCADGNNQGQAVSSLTSGWSNTINSIPSFHGCYVATSNAVLGSGSQSMTFNMNGGIVDSAELSFMLLNPASAVATPIFEGLFPDFLNRPRRIVAY